MSTIDITDLSILIVEPSVTQLKVVKKHLQEESIAYVEGASSGTEALEKAERFPPDLIISSMYLPDMTATELVSRLRESETQQDTAFMLISSETNPCALDPIRQAGVVAILPKPFNHADLTRALRTTVDFIDPEQISLEHYDIEDLRVLLVDDSSLARKHITRVLNNLGICQISTANNGKQALKIFSQSQEEFDLIVTDYNMPEMDGKQLIESIRLELGNSLIPILMVTSIDNTTRLDHVQQAGVSAICGKPFDSDTVKQILYRIFE